MTIWTSAARAMGGLLTAALLFAGLAQWDCVRGSRLRKAASLIPRR
jgi:hypothetical protein